MTEAQKVGFGFIMVALLVGLILIASILGALAALIVAGLAVVTGLSIQSRDRRIGLILIGGGFFVAFWAAVALIGVLGAIIVTVALAIFGAAIMTGRL